MTATTTQTATLTGDGRKHITNSRLACLKTCMMRHFYMYELGIRQRQVATPLRMGRAVHHGLDLLAGGATLNEAIAQATTDYEVPPDWVQTDEQAEDWAVERETVAAMIAGYRWRWGAETAEIVATERAFDIPIINPETGAPTPSFRAAGKIDKIIRLADGRLAIREHKTSGEDLAPESDYWARLRIDQQISLYFIAARKAGFDVQTVEYDVLRKPTIRPRKLTKAELSELFTAKTYCGYDVDDNTNAAAHLSGRETPTLYGLRLLSDMAQRPEFYFARQEIPRLDSDLRSFEFELWQFQQLLRDCQRNERWPRNTAACLHPSKCPMWELCIAGVIPQPSDPLPSGYERVDHVHPELSA